MAFDLFGWLVKKTGPALDTGQIAGKTTAENFLDEEPAACIEGLETALQRMAFSTCVQRIGDVIGAVKWETYRRGKKVRARESWSWNYAPNPNQTRAQFFSRLINRLYSMQEALIVERQDGSRYVADSFFTEKHLSGDIYRDIVSDGEAIPGTFKAADVLHLTLEGAGIRRNMTAVALANGRLLKSATGAYIRGAGKHGILTIDDFAEAEPRFEEKYSELINQNFKAYFKAENAVLPLYRGYDYKEAARDGRETAGTRDIRALMDDIIELTAEAFGVPSSIVTGKGIKEEDFRAFMSAPVLPLINMITQEINRKLYGPQLVNSGTYIVPNLAAVRYRDVFDIADPIDKLIGSGAFCINDILVRLGITPINEPWANQHWMTKNYSPADELIRGMNSNTDQPASPGKEETTDGEHTEGPTEE